MKAWLLDRIREVTTHAGLLMTAVGAYITSEAQDVVDAVHDLTGASVSRASVRIVAVIITAIGGTLIGTPK